MFGSVDYFLHCFKENVLNNLIVAKPITLEEMYEKLEAEIELRELVEEKQQFIANLDGAFLHMYEEIFGL